MVTAKKATAPKTAAPMPAKTVSAATATAPNAAAPARAKPAGKVPAKAVAKPVAKPRAVKPAKPKKPKLVRDSFTIPKPEYLVLDELKARANKLASPAKKSELLRAGIKALALMADAAFVAALKAVPAIKTGRPAKS